VTIATILVFGYGIPAVLTAVVTWRMLADVAEYFGHPDPWGTLGIGIVLGLVWPVTWWSALRSWWRGRCWP